MVTFLSQIFIKSKDYKNPQVRKAYGTLCSILGIFLNVCLFAGKYVAGYLSGSVAVMADAFNNLSDAGSSFITLVGFRFAGKKPDIDHPFGHGRFEYISGLVVAIIIILMAFELLKSSIDKIIHPMEVETGIVAVAILVCSIVIKLYMFVYNMTVGRKIASSAMKATAMDSLCDSVATLVVLVSMLLAKFCNVNIDGVAGLFVTVFIIYAGWNAARETISPLLGRPADKEFVKEIENIVMAHSKIIGVHDLLVHDYGPGRVMISLHAEIPGDSNIFEIHDEVDNIERELNEKLGCASVIHIDPIEADNEVVTELKGKVIAIVKSIDTRISIHDFRVVKGPSHTNLVFDVVLPYDVKLADEEAKKIIDSRVKEVDASYYTVVTVDRSYIE